MEKFLAFFLLVVSAVILQSSRFFEIIGVTPNFLLVSFLGFLFLGAKSKISLGEGLTFAVAVFFTSLIWFYFWSLEIFILVLLGFSFFALKAFLSGNRLTDFLIGLASVTIVFYTILGLLKFSRFQPILVGVEVLENVFFGLLLWLALNRFIKIHASREA